MSFLSRPVNDAFRSKRSLLPGIAISAAVACAAVFSAPLVAHIYPLPAMVIALLIGISLNPIAMKPVFADGIEFCVKTVLRWSVALLGLRTALSEIISLGLTTAVIVMLSMIATLLAGFGVTRLFGLSKYYGALAGAATAVCGASATLATATVLPDYKGKQVEIAFVIVAVNALSTVAIIVYPALCQFFGFDDQTTGIMLGATIHDVAQVVGAAYSVSDPAGDTAIVVKLFRVLLLLPVVVGIGLLFSQRVEGNKIPIPVFAFVFIILCIVNSTITAIPNLNPVYGPIKSALVLASNAGLLVAIGALGLGTSASAIVRIGWRHAATVILTTIVILVAVICCLIVMR